MLAGVPLHTDRPPSLAVQVLPASVQRFSALAASIPKENPPAPVGAGALEATFGGTVPATSIIGGKLETLLNDVSGEGGSAGTQLPECQYRCPCHPSEQELYRVPWHSTLPSA